MILQSEVDQLNMHKRLKMLLILLAIIMVAVVMYAVITVRKENASSMSVQPVEKNMTQNEQEQERSEGIFSPEEIEYKLNERSRLLEDTTTTPPPEDLIQKLNEPAVAPSKEQSLLLSPEEQAMQGLKN